MAYWELPKQLKLKNKGFSVDKIMGFKEQEKKTILCLNCGSIVEENELLSHRINGFCNKYNVPRYLSLPKHKFR
jgi:hypothetical protein